MSDTGIKIAKRLSNWFQNKNIPLNGLVAVCYNNNYALFPVNNGEANAYSQTYDDLPTTLKQRVEKLHSIEGLVGIVDQQQVNVILYDAAGYLRKSLDSNLLVVTLYASNLIEDPVEVYFIEI